MEPYPGGQFGFIDDPDCQFGNGSVWTRTRTQSDGLEPLITLVVVHQHPEEHHTQIQRIALYPASDPALLALPLLSVVFKTCLPPSLIQKPA